MRHTAVLCASYIRSSLHYATFGVLQGYQHLRRRNLRHLVRQVAPGDTRNTLSVFTPSYMYHPACICDLYQQVGRTGSHFAEPNAYPVDSSSLRSSSSSRRTYLLTLTSCANHRGLYGFCFVHCSAVLDDLGVEYFADFGTLLGMYREVRICEAAPYMQL